MHTRTQIRLTHNREVAEFVSILNSTGTTEKFIIENFDGSLIVDARSFLGVIYASSEFGEDLFLVNTTNDGKVPSAIDKFRP